MATIELREVHFPIESVPIGSGVVGSSITQELRVSIYDFMENFQPHSIEVDNISHPPTSPVTVDLQLLDNFNTFGFSIPDAQGEPHTLFKANLEDIVDQTLLENAADSLAIYTQATIDPDTSVNSLGIVDGGRKDLHNKLEAAVKKFFDEKLPGFLGTYEHHTGIEQNQARDIASLIRAAKAYQRHVR